MNISEPFIRRPVATTLLSFALLMPACNNIEHPIRDREEDARRATGGDPNAGRDAIRRYGCLSCHTIPGEWTIQEIVDHLVETYRPGVDELRCLLAGQRPPGEPVPASLQSKAPHLRPWPWLLGELHRLNADVLGLLAAVPPQFETTARAPIVMVVNVPRPGGGFDPLHWVEDLDWKAYAIASWRLHPIDHLNQAKKVLAGKA